jgi:hypothetical protein
LGLAFSKLPVVGGLLGETHERRCRDLSVRVADYFWILSSIRQTLSLPRYWSPALVQELQLASDDEYAEAFRHFLTMAVRSRLRSTLPWEYAAEGSGGRRRSASYLL